MKDKKKTVKFLAHLFVIALVFVSQEVSSDAGNCVRYGVELKFQNNEKLEGFIQIHSYNPMIKNDSEKLFDLVTNGRAKEIVLFKRIYTIEYPRFFPQSETPPYGFKLSASIIEETQTIPVNSIEQLDLLGISLCEHGDFPKASGSDAFLVQYHAHVIRGFTKEEIQRMQSRPIGSMICEDSISSESYQTIYLLSYNNEIGEAKLKEFCSELLLDKDPNIKYPTPEFYERRRSQYRVKKESFRHKKIIVVTI